MTPKASFFLWRARDGPKETFLFLLRARMNLLDLYCERKPAAEAEEICDFNGHEGSRSKCYSVRGLATAALPDSESGCAQTAGVSIRRTGTVPDGL